MTTILDVRPPLPPGVYTRPKRPLPFPFDRPGVRLYARARAALWHALRSLGLTDGEVLVPAYNHGSEVEALTRAGLTCVFFDQDDRGEPIGLDALVSDRTRALYLLHALGFPEDAARWRAWCEQRGLLLLEDAAQAWLASVDGRPVGSIGDVAIFCVYKSIGVPDGGAVVARSPVPGPIRRGSWSVARVAGKHAAWAGIRSSAAASIRRRLDRPWAFSPDLEFGLGDVDAAASRATTWLLPRLSDPSVQARRLANYRWLLARLGEHVPTRFANPPDGASPFVFPLAVADTPPALRALLERGVDGLDLWSIPHPSLDMGSFPNAAELRRTVVGLPVHQELRPSDLELIARAAGSALRST